MTMDTGTNLLGANIRRFFQQNGLTMEPPKTFYYSDGKGTLMVRATLEDLDIIERVLARLGANGMLTKAAATTPDPQQEELRLVQKGKLLYEEGRLDEAKDLLKQALQLNPENKGAYYYLSLIGEAQKGGAVRPVAEGPAAAATELFTRMFKVDSRTFAENLRQIEGITGRKQGVGNLTNTMATFRAVLADFGVKMEPPASVFFNDRLGTLMARATREDLDRIEKVVQMVNRAPAQVTVEVKFCEIEIKDGKKPELEKLFGVRFAYTLTEPLPESEATPAFTSGSAILTAAQYRSAMTNLSKLSGMDLLAMPRITTLSGRQAQLKAVDVQTVVTDVVPSTNSPSAKAAKGDRTADSSPITEPFEVGATVDLVPTVLADGETIRLTVIPSVREFLGYDGVASNKTSTASVKPGAAKALDEPRPRFRVRQNLIHTTVGDGQTLVLAGGEWYEEVITRAGKERRAPKDEPAKLLLIFVTPTLIDPAGNRVHTEEQPVRGAR